MDLEEIAAVLVEKLSTLRFSRPIHYVYNPLDYARRSHSAYVKRYGTRPCEVLLLGMNPGPWGMVQTGVPFGEVSMVRDWLGIEQSVGKPDREHPKRPVQGFACQRSEVSGRRLWGWARQWFKSPEKFFDRFFVANYCPLAFLEESGRNLTPDRIPTSVRAPMLKACDEALRDTVSYLRPKHVIGVGKFAEDRAAVALEGMDVKVGRILHPSPASPQANRGWARQASTELVAQGIRLPTIRG